MRKRICRITSNHDTVWTLGVDGVVSIVEDWDGPIFIFRINFGDGRTSNYPLSAIHRWDEEPLPESAP